VQTRFKKLFVTGLIIFVPLVITLYAFVLVFNLLDGVLAPTVERFFGAYVPGLGILAILLIIMGLGALAATAVGRRLVEVFERLLTKLPLVKAIYPIIKQASEAMLLREGASFQKVVLVEYPRKGLYTLGFVTSGGMKEAEERTGKKLLNVFIPTSPNPTSGMLIVVPEEDVISIDMTVEDAVGFIFSGGFFQKG